MFIIDAHQDIAYNALEWGRNIRLPVETIRRREAHKRELGERVNQHIVMSGLAEMRKAGFGLVFGTLFVQPANKEKSDLGSYSVSYRDAEEAHRLGQAQLDYYRELAEEPGVSLILNREDLADLVVAWEGTQPDDKERPFGIVPLMEGADPIRTPDEAAKWFADGVRIVGLAWQATRYSGGTHMPGPLTPAGKTLLKEMERVGLTLDISHLAEESFWQALEGFAGPVMASHSNCRVFTPTDRHLSDDMIRALAERDAVIGMVIVNPFLDGRWGKPDKFEVGLDQVVRHIDHICQLTGSARHVGIGSDIDGGFGLNETPKEMKDVGGLALLAAALRASGYKEEDVVNIMGGNWRRFLERSLPET